jgi:hypothetical protein
MITNKLALFITGFIIGLIISFFYVNAQYQKQTDLSAKEAATKEELPPGHPPVDSEEAKTAISSSKIGPLEAYGKTSDKKPKEVPKAERAESAYKNIQVLKGLPANEVLTVMQSFSEGLGVKCVYCHVSAEEAAKDDKPTKQTARKMLEMVREINKGYPTGGQVTCYTCHRGSAQPAS